MSLNDPQWGNRGGGNRDGGNRGGNQGPPDLEELWRDFNRRLSALFGGRGGNGSGDSGGRPPRLSPRQFGGGLGMVLALVVVIWMASGFYIVDASQRGVVLQFGRFLQTTEPGLRWRLPYPVQSHELVNLTGVRTVEIGYRGQERNKVLKEALMLTDDENIINIQFAVQYILRDPQEYLFNNRLPDEVVIQAAETAMREIVGGNKMDFVLYEGREEVAVSAATLIQQIVDRYQTGIQISKVTMQNAQPPEQVQAAFDDAVKAGQDLERQKSEGQAYANDVIPKARGTASRLFEEANGYRQRVIANAEGEASRFQQILPEYARAPEVTRQRMYLDTVQQVLSSSAKVVVDAKGGGNLLFMPLDKLMQVTGAAGQPAEAPRAPAAGSGEAAAPVPSGSDATANRSRESLRGRERGER
ncbi:MAG: FtsH protease activity modulator HflK [Betaproteobacteria bacterium]|nr:FtsH protease activity modulator HflK [Betaproteobacteria bacterium]